MTTIACDGVRIAADGLVTGNGAIHHRSFPKVHALRSGAVVGITGTIFLYQEALDFLEGKRDSLDVGDDFEAIILHPDGRTECMDGKGRRYAQPAPCATGTGASFALAAMAAGAGAREAVAIACDLDPYSGGLIVQLAPTQPKEA